MSKVVLDYGALSAQGAVWEGNLFTDTGVINETNVTVSSISSMVTSANNCYIEYGQCIEEMAEDYNTVIDSFKNIDEKTKEGISRDLDDVGEGAIIG